jgi:hypothetical protein
MDPVGRKLLKSALRRALVPSMIALFAVAMTLPAAAADRITYRGTTSQDRRVSIEVLQRDSGRRILRDFRVHFTMTCEDATTRSYGVTWRFTERLGADGSFAVKDRVVERVSAFSLAVDGEVRWASAHGTFEFLSPSLTDDDQAQLCTTGSLDWSAEREPARRDEGHHLRERAGERGKNRCRGSAPTIVGSPGRDVITGTRENDVIATLGGRDTVKGLDGDDVICVGAGHDVVNGGKGDDTVIGGDGPDRLKGAGGESLLIGGKGDDHLFLRGRGGRSLGGNGDDLLFGGGAADRVYGGAGEDRCSVYAGDDLCEGGSGRDQMMFRAGSVEVDLIAGTATGPGYGDDLIRGIEDLRGSVDSDVLIGDGTDNTIVGMAGHDTIDGGDGDDVLTGRGGTDTIDGGPGSDTCDGESEANCEV